MQRILGHVLTVASLAVLASAVAPACAANDQSIYIHHTLAPPLNRQNGVCTYEPDPTSTFLAEGTLDVLVRDSYNAYLLVGSQLISRGSTVQVRAESNRAHLNGAVVTVTETSGAFLGSFTATGTGFVDPQGSDAASFGLLGVTLIDAPTTAKIAASLQANQTKLVLANVKAFGTTLGGVDLESGGYQFPIRVCKGCLISFVGGDDPASPGKDCNLPLGGGSSSGTSSVTIPCQIGQDEMTPCQLCAPQREACTGKLP
jgi:hypothetical protein